MIVIRVELWSAVTGEQTELARMVVDNIGGDMTRGDYRCRTLRGGSKAALDRSLARITEGGVQRSGEVYGHPRLREHVWNLVAKALASMGYGQNGGRRLTVDENDLPF
ncbi:hypothetical protein [Novosphingobium sp. FSW06-99]|uniref:hypothetical protein n=1 Tax=Novosphingobium sp. FSW06-99 TaxID=1739113 RepID=UPI00076C9168|nr:hypothetical protein [Novosphingobium sp. FSW06-99]KUR80943.1 hypothetical protein AQZ49_02655 [Novosphingobium sp. FSW06-99]